MSNTYYLVDSGAKAAKSKKILDGWTYTLAGADLLIKKSPVSVSLTTASQFINNTNIKNIVSSSGSLGDSGIKGDTGVKGDTGAKGMTGSTGNPGAQGDTGVSSTGSSGDKGETGVSLKGATGPANGAKGDTGIQGATGVGTLGLQGPTGISIPSKLNLYRDITPIPLFLVSSFVMITGPSDLVSTIVVPTTAKYVRVTNIGGGGSGDGAGGGGGGVVIFTTPYIPSNIDCVLYRNFGNYYTYYSYVSYGDIISAAEYGKNGNITSPGTGGNGYCSIGTATVMLGNSGYGSYGGNSGLGGGSGSQGCNGGYGGGGGATDTITSAGLGGRPLIIIEYMM